MNIGHTQISQFINIFRVLLHVRLLCEPPPGYMNVFWNIMFACIIIVNLTLYLRFYRICGILLAPDNGLCRNDLRSSVMR